MRPTLTSLFRGIALGATAAAAHAQNGIAQLAQVGDTLPNGDHIAAFTHLRVNDNGSYALIVRSDNANPLTNAAIVRDGQIVLAEGIPAPGAPAQTVLEIVDIDLDDTDRLASVLELTLGFALYYNGTLILRENDPANAVGFGPNARYVDVNKVNSNASNQLVLRCTVEDPAYPLLLSSCLVRLDIGPGGVILGETLLARSGDFLPGQADRLDFVTLPDRALTFLDNGGGIVGGHLEPGATPGEEVLYYGLTLIYQGNQPSPVGARTYADERIRASAVNLAGDYAFSALLDASNTNNDEVIIRNGSVYLREGGNFTALPGAPVIESLGFETLFMTDSGNLVHFVHFDLMGPGSRAIMKGNTTFLRTGDMVLGGGIVTLISDVEYGFHASDNGDYMLALAQVDNGPVALLFVEQDLGEPYCAAENNSTGGPAVTSALGTSLSGLNQFGLLTTGAPAGQFAYYLASLTQANNLFPGGSQGRLCLGGTIARFNAAVGQISPAGTFFRTIDLTSIPTSPSVSVMPGEEWRFQMWFRDLNPGATSNFSLPVKVAFN